MNLRPDNVNSFDWFAEKQNKVFRTIRQHLQMNATQAEPKAVTQTKRMYKACMNIGFYCFYINQTFYVNLTVHLKFLGAMDSLGLQPVVDVLKDFALPKYPAALNKTLNKSTSYTFDWITSIAKIKKYVRNDLIIGFDIYPEPGNRTLKRLTFGLPDASSMLPL